MGKLDVEHDDQVYPLRKLSYGRFQRLTADINDLMVEACLGDTVPLEKVKGFPYDLADKLMKLIQGEDLVPFGVAGKSKVSSGKPSSPVSIRGIGEQEKP